MKSLLSNIPSIACCLSMLFTVLPIVAGQDFDLEMRRGDPSRNVLSQPQWQEIDQSISRGLQFLASQQLKDGSFDTAPEAKSAITSLIVMTFLANGHLPDEGRYGKQLHKAIEYVCSTQRKCGIIAVNHPDIPTISRDFEHRLGKVVAYNHAISSLMLSEVYGMLGEDNDLVTSEVIENAMRVTLTMHAYPKPGKDDKGGWRYAQFQSDAEADLSLTGWQVMFLRSAKNAGFDVPTDPVKQSTEYVLRCFRPDYGTFNYYIRGKVDRRSRGMAGAGILALAHAGLHDRDEATAAGDWILKHGFEKYNNQLRFTQTGWYNDCYHYGVFYCSQAMYQLGGGYWDAFFPATSGALLENQRHDGSWPLCNSEGKMYGHCYSTSMSLLALSAPNQLLPIFHR